MTSEKHDCPACGQGKLTLQHTYVCDNCHSDIADDTLSKLNLISEFYNDPNFIILSEVERVLQSQKVWAGMEYNYGPINPVHYKPLLDKVRDAIDSIARLYGVQYE